MGDAPVLPALASKPAHVGIHILQEEAPGCTPHACAWALCKQLDEGDNVGGVDCVGLLHNGGCTWVHLNHLYPAFIPLSLLPESLSTVTYNEWQSKGTLTPGSLPAQTPATQQKT